MNQALHYFIVRSQNGKNYYRIDQVHSSTAVAPPTATAHGGVVLDAILAFLFLKRRNVTLLTLAAFIIIYVVFYR